MEHPYFKPVKEYLERKNSEQPRAPQKNILSKAVSLGLTRMAVRQKTERARTILLEIVKRTLNTQS